VAMGVPISPRPMTEIFFISTAFIPPFFYPVQIRNSKHEIRNKFKFLKYECS
jgi:hypothetical protein